MTESCYVTQYVFRLPTFLSPPTSTSQPRRLKAGITHHSWQFFILVYLLLLCLSMCSMCMRMHVLCVMCACLCVCSVCISVCDVCRCACILCVCKSVCVLCILCLCVCTVCVHASLSVLYVLCVCVYVWIKIRGTLVEFSSLSTKGSRNET